MGSFKSFKEFVFNEERSCFKQLRSSSEFYPGCQNLLDLVKSWLNILQTKEYDMKKALVCGAGGFIGGHLVKKLKKTKHLLEAELLFKPVGPALKFRLISRAILKSLKSKLDQTPNQLWICNPRCGPHFWVHTDRSEPR